MTTARRRVLMIAAVGALLMLAFPPWETFGGRYLGHSAITSPPVLTDARPDTHGWALPAPEPIARVSVALLTGQFAALWICAGVAFLLLGPPRRP